MYRIKHGNGTYYAGQSGIGPTFGASHEDAATFETMADAIRAMTHWAFGDCEIEEDFAEDEQCNSK